MLHQIVLHLYLVWPTKFWNVTVAIGFCAFSTIFSALNIYYYYDFMFSTPTNKAEQLEKQKGEEDIPLNPEKSSQIKEEEGEEKEEDIKWEEKEDLFCSIRAPPLVKVKENKDEDLDMLARRRAYGGDCRKWKQEKISIAAKLDSMIAEATAASAKLLAAAEDNCDYIITTELVCVSREKCNDLHDTLEEKTNYVRHSRILWSLCNA